MPRSTRFPVMLAVKTRPSPRKLTASALPAAAVSVRRSASRTWGRNPQPVSSGLQPLGALLELRSLVDRHRSLEDADHATSTDYTRQHDEDGVGSPPAANHEDASL